MFGFGKPRPAMREAPLGTTLVALRMHAGVRLPPACVELVFSAAGQARRAPFSRAVQGELALAYHPGPYETVFAPFAGAPELGLRLRYLADAADPRVAQQRFDLFLFSEAGEALPVEALHQAVAGAVRDALAQGALELPACTTLDEWHGFRAGLNELLYTRFGLTVDDCVPVDLGDAIDYAQLLRARATPLAGAAGVAVPVRDDAPPAMAASGTSDRIAVPAPPAAWAAAPAVTDPQSAPTAAAADALALRRLFLELPAWSAGVRMLALPAGAAAARRDVLQRCALAALDVNTMPALSWAAPNRPLRAAAQAGRAAHSVAAAQALDQTWALLARWRVAAQGAMPPHGGAAGTQPAAVDAALLDEADRLTANLAFHLAARRAVAEPPAPMAAREEPQL